MELISTAVSHCRHNCNRRSSNFCLAGCQVRMKGRLCLLWMLLLISSAHVLTSSWVKVMPW
jgi:hypothetical protein